MLLQKNTNLFINVVIDEALYSDLFSEKGALIYTVPKAVDLYDFILLRVQKSDGTYGDLTGLVVTLGTRAYVNTISVFDPRSEKKRLSLGDTLTGMLVVGG